MRKLVIDIETKNLFADVGKADPTLLDLSYIGVYDSETDAYTGYWENDLHKLWPLIERANMLIGYNSDHFDIPLLNKYYPGDLSTIKSLDLLVEIRKSLGRRIGLNSVAAGTLGREKLGHGTDAITWWKKGELDKIAKYCLEDVRITKDVYDYMLANRRIKFKDGANVVEIPIDTKGWDTVTEAPAMTHTLPF